MKSISTLGIVILIFIAISTNANDTLIRFGQNLSGAPSWNYKGGGTNLDLVPWKAAVYMETNWIVGAPAAMGFGASAPVRNTAIPENTTTGGGGAIGARYPTMYFRKTINIANPGAYTSFSIRAQFDDAIVVWVNGQEALRNNIGSNPAYATLATTSIAGNGATIFTGSINTSLFIPGNNIIAVEIHQSSLTSSDLFFDMELVGINTLSVTRGPFLQIGSQTGITIRWKTDVATNSRVTYGTSFGTYTNTVDSALLTTDHIVRISGLTADTKYYYTIGSTTTTLQNSGLNNFLTLPPANVNRKLRVVAFGDCGDGSANQVNVKNAFKNYLGSNDVDAMLLLGDNTYNSGLDNEYQTLFFDPYKDDILKSYKLYPAPGNHDYGENNTLPFTGNRNNAYFQNFSLPTAGECGGLASGTESYYSFDIGDVHLLSLDSYGTEAANFNTKLYDTLGPQATWIKADLAANTKKWVVAYFHHAPYTKIGLNSDGAGELTNIRENFIRILERYGVDLVICGHSHGHERSYLLKNYYKSAPADPALLEANFNKALHTADSSSALYNGSTGSCAYTYNSGKYNHGTVYTVSGSAGKFGHATQTGYPHNAMFYSSNAFGGVFYFEVDSNRLDGKYVSYSGLSTPVVRDSFTIFKDVKKFTSYTVSQNSNLVIQSSWKGSYNWYQGGTSAPNLSGNRNFTVPTNTTGTFRYVVKDFSSNSCLKDSFEVIVTLPIPVTLNSFNVSLQNHKVILDWTTSLEQNNKYFIVEKSTDGIHFNYLTRVNGAGNSSTRLHYNSTDPAPSEGINYYRLSQTNFDGKTNYFEIKSIQYKSQFGFSAGIATLSNGINVNFFSNKKDKIKVRILDAMGRQLVSESFPVNNGSTKRSYKLLPGLYITQFSNNKNEIITNNIIIK
jgi:3',5'-cyclic AMP phosphodiesterase CpdA